MELEVLKSSGALPEFLEQVPMNGTRVITFADLISKPEAEQVTGGKVVVIPNAIWLATSKGRAAQEAVSVYSGDAGKTVGCWKREQGEFLLMRVDGDRLTTQKQFKFKEEKIMADLGTTMEAMEAFDEDIESIKGSAESTPIEGPTATMGTEDGKELSKQAIARAQATQDIAAIRSILGKESLMENSDIQRQNHLKGKFMFFITMSNPVVKVSRKNEAELTPDGNRIYDPTEKEATEKQLNEWKKEGKQIPMQYAKKVAYIDIREAGPGAIKGMVIKTPAASEIGFENKASKGTDDMVVRILSKEEGLAYIGANYGDYIEEDRDVMGNMAAKLYLRNGLAQKSKKQKEKDAVTAAGVKTYSLSARLVVDSDARKKTVTRNNFFPLRVYKTVPVANANAEQKKKLNFNFASVITVKEKQKAIRAEDLAKITTNPDGTVTSAWVDKGEAAKIKKFDGVSDSDVLPSFELPLRSRAAKKNGSGYTYKFDYDEMGAKEGSGPENRPEFQKLIKLTGMSTSEFIKMVARAAAASSKKGNASNAVRTAELLAATTSANVHVTNMKSYSDVLNTLKDIESGLS